jgi:hypothetical protein
MLAIFSACSSVSEDLKKNPPAAAAEGKATVDTDQFGALPLEIEAKNLPPPGQVSPGADIYVVWVRAIHSLPNEPPEAALPVQNVGALKMEGNKGSVKTSIPPLRNFQVFVTAESLPIGRNPASNPVLWADFSLS